MAIKKAYLNVILFTTAYKLITSISIKSQPLRSLRTLYIQLISCQSTCRCSSTIIPFYMRHCEIMDHQLWNNFFFFINGISFREVGEINPSSFVI